MGKLLGISEKAKLLAQAGFIFIWLTNLSPLAGTDTYYSVYLLCGVGALLCLCGNFRRRVENNRRQRMVLALFSALFSFAVLLANYSLFEPLSVLQNAFDWVCCFIGGYFAARAVLRYLLNRQVPAAEAVRKHPRQVFFLVFISIAVIDLMYLLFCRYPGVLTTDSITTIQQLTGLEDYDNTMPFWHTVTVQVFVKLGLLIFGNMNAAVAFFHGVQILFLAACFAYALMTLYQTGIPGFGLMGIYFLYAVMPHQIAYSVTLWKDIPFAGAALLFVTALYRLLRQAGKLKGIDLLVFAVGAMGLSLWRTNGWYAFAVTTIVMLFLLRKQYKPLLAIMAGVLVLCWVLLHPVLNVLGVKKTNYVEAFAVPFQQIARVLANDRELTEEETAMLCEIFWLDKVGEAYDPQTVDPVKFETFRYDRVSYITEHAADYAKLYFRLGQRYPEDYLKAWIEETKGYWNGGYKFWIYTKGVEDNPLGISAQYGNNFLSRLFDALFRYLEKPEILQPLYSIGLYVWALIGCCLLNVLKRRKEFLLTIPILVLVVGLWLGTPVFAEFRYAYPIILTVPVIIAVTLYPVREQEDMPCPAGTES